MSDNLQHCVSASPFRRLEDSSVKLVGRESNGAVLPCELETRRGEVCSKDGLEQGARRGDGTETNLQSASTHANSQVRNR
jgi:hypothetical protein